ncbi:outer membrane lipoprotein-sorting protein, partial [candidate division KSB1 bacterium]|nr:outer membrane lipoprotein-sorting protein [candidate division KSB1 bacterium]
MKTGFHVMTMTILLWLSFVSAQDAATVKEIVQKIDELYRSQSSYAEMEMEIITPHWQRTLRLKVWTQGMKKTFIRILEPQKERGVGTLRIGNEMWNY